MTGIGLITLYGYPALLDQQASANIKNMENTLIVLQSDLNSLVYKNVPYQETAIQVAGGVLKVLPGDASYNKGFSIYNGTDYVISNYTPGEIRYTSDQQNVVLALQNGGVEKCQYGGISGGSTMIAGPRWFYDSSNPKTLVVTLINLNTISGNQFAESGIGTVGMRLEKSPPDIIQDYLSERTVTITYFDDISDVGVYRTAWRNYFSTIGTVSPSPQLDLTKSGVDRLVIKQYNITILSL